MISGTVFSRADGAFSYGPWAHGGVHQPTRLLRALRLALRSRRGLRCVAVGSRDCDEREEPCPADEWCEDDQSCHRPSKAADERKEQDQVEKLEQEHVDSLCPS